jgi:hypothetical protein
MARFIFALFAILALAVSPLAASARIAACGMVAAQAVAASTPASGTSVAFHHAGGSKADPCCDKARLGCSKGCPTACFANVVGLAVLSSVVVLGGRTTFNPPTIKALGSHEPIGPDHPPKSMA